MLSADVTNKVAKELATLARDPCEGLKVLVNEENLADVSAEIEGPAGTPYEGGVFRMRLTLPVDFPLSPPKGTFLTKIFHPNVSKAGEICVNVLKKDWKPELGLKHVLLVIRCLLIEPFAESALNEEAGRLLLEDYQEFFSHAKMMTQIHAAGKRERPTPLTTSSGANAAADANAQTGVNGKPVGVASPVQKKAKPSASRAKGGAKARLRRL